MNTYWIVMGTTGEYSDRSEWAVRLFKTELEAQEYVTFLHKEYMKFDRNSCGYRRSNMLELVNHMEEFDPRFHEDYTGTEWFLDSVEGDF